MGPYQVQLELLGGRIIEGAEIPLLEWAEKYQQRKELNKQLKKLEGEL